jgi:hypothetical protein
MLLDHAECPKVFQGLLDDGCPLKGSRKFELMLALGGNGFLIGVEEKLAEDVSSPATQRD